MKSVCGHSVSQRPERLSKDIICRFGGHQPGDTDYGVPLGGCHGKRPFPGTSRTMEFCQDPDGAFLWIDENGCTFEFRTTPRSRIFEKINALRAQTRKHNRDIPIERPGGKLINRASLSVDRKWRDDPLRLWCEKPFLNYDNRISIHVNGNLSVRFFDVSWPLASVYSRRITVIAKVRLDIYADDTLCLPPVEQTEKTFTGYTGTKPEDGLTNSRCGAYPRIGTA